MNYSLCCFRKIRSNLSQQNLFIFFFFSHKFVSLYTVYQRLATSRIPFINLIQKHLKLCHNLPDSQFCAQKSLPQPTHFPGLAPCDSLLFSKLKSMLKGWRFGTTGDIKINSSKALQDIWKETFWDCFVKWKSVWIGRGGQGRVFFEQASYVYSIFKAQTILYLLIFFLNRSINWILSRERTLVYFERN